MTGALGEPIGLAMLFFFVFIAASLGITCFAARRTRTTEDFYAAGRSVTAVPNGLALAGDYMSAASFLGIAGLVALSGFDRRSIKQPKILGLAGCTLWLRNCWRISASKAAT